MLLAKRGRRPSVERRGPTAHSSLCVWSIYSTLILDLLLIRQLLEAMGHIRSSRFHARHRLNAMEKAHQRNSGSPRV